MKKLSTIYKELGIDFKFPIRIEDSNGFLTYIEKGDGYCARYEHDASGYVTHVEKSDDSWYKCERDTKARETYYEDNKGVKRGTPTRFPKFS